MEKAPGLEGVAENIELVVNGNEPVLQFARKVSQVLLEDLIELALGFDLNAVAKVGLDGWVVVLMAFDESGEEGEGSLNDWLAHSDSLFQSLGRFWPALSCRVSWFPI
jgi:hypothetical protein